MELHLFRSGESAKEAASSKGVKSIQVSGRRGSVVIVDRPTVPLSLSLSLKIPRTLFRSPLSQEGQLPVRMSLFNHQCFMSID